MHRSFQGSTSQGGATTFVDCAVEPGCTIAAFQSPTVGDAQHVSFDVSASVSALGEVHAWVGLKNSDDQGTQFDVKVDLVVNGTSIASGLRRCVTGVTRSPSLAQDVTVPWNTFSGAPLSSGDVVRLQVSARIGTNPDDTKCAGPGGSHNNAVGLRLYYDAASRPSGFDATISPQAGAARYLHSDGAACGNTESTGVRTRFLDSTAPSASAARCKDSTTLNFAGGDPFKVIGVWSLAPITS